MTNPAQHRTAFIALLAGAVVLLSGAIYAAAPAHGSAGYKRCAAVVPQKSIPAINIRARGVSCETARGVAKQWMINFRAEGCPSTNAASCRVRSFKCTGSSTKDGQLLQDCRRSGARVLFTLQRVPPCVKTRSCPGASKPSTDEGMRS